MKFSETPWHRHSIEALRRMADTGRIPHAILLSGQTGTGKMLVARAFAQYVHCQSRRDGEACGRCPDCLQHQSLNHPDLHFIYPVFKKDSGKAALSSDFFDRWKQFISENPYMEPEKWPEALGADNKQPIIYKDESAEILRVASMSAFSSEKKIFIIWQPEKMNMEAANKLLKILEEPFADTIFILVSNAPSLILPTIFSRTARINMQRPSDADIAAWLRLHGYGEADAHAAAHLAEGNIARALSGGGIAEEKEFGAVFRDLMRKAYTRDAASLREITEGIAAMKREKSRRFLLYATRMVRENFIYNYGIPGLNRMTPEEEAFSSRFAPFIHTGNVGRMEREFSRAETDIARNANAKIVLFDLSIKLMGMLRMKQKL